MIISRGVGITRKGLYKYVHQQVEHMISKIENSCKSWAVKQMLGPNGERSHFGTYGNRTQHFDGGEILFP